MLVRQSGSVGPTQDIENVYELTLERLNCRIFLQYVGSSIMKVYVSHVIPTVMITAAQTGTDFKILHHGTLVLF